MGEVACQHKGELLCRCKDSCCSPNSLRAEEVHKVLSQRTFAAAAAAEVSVTEALLL